MKKYIIFSVTSLIFCIFAYAGDISVYTESIVKSFVHKKILKNTNDNNSEKFIPCYIHFSSLTALSHIENLGIEVNNKSGSIVTANIPLSIIDTLSNIEGIDFIEAGTPIFKNLDIVRSETGVTSVHEGLELPSGYTGKGVIVGIIDQGIQLDHINFYDKDGNLRIKRLWIQTDTLGTAPDGYDYGSEYTTQQEIESIKYDVINGTHGIHVAGIAAGGYKGCDYYGVATESDIVFVSYDGYTTSISDAISYIYDYAKDEGKPAVINMSIGGFMGPRDGTSTFDVLADELQDNGLLLVGAAGNNGTVESHVSKTLSSNSDKLKTFMPCLYSLSNIDYVEIYGNSNTNLNVTLTLYNKQNNSSISKSSTLYTMFGNSVTFTVNEGIVGTIEMYCEKMPYTNKPHVLIVKSLTQQSDNYAIGIEISSAKDNIIHAWTYKDVFKNYEIDGYTNGDTDYAITEVGGTGNRIITVGSYALKNILGGEVGEISTLSSKGPTVDGRQKPDITAPGDGVISSYSNSSNIALSSFYKPYLDLGTTVTIDNETYYYGAMAGTSMAAPMVTGTIATWLQARPTLSPEEVKEIIKETARTDEFTGDIVQSGNTWGYGKIDAWAGLKECLELNSIDGVEPISEKVVLYKYSNNNSSISLLFTKECNNVTISIYDISGKIVSINSYMGIAQGEEKNITLNNFGSGIYIIRIKSDNITETFKLIKH